MARQSGFFAEREYEAQKAEQRRLKQQAAVYRAQVSAQREAERALRAYEHAKMASDKAAARERNRLEEESSRERERLEEESSRERERLQEEASQRHVESQIAEVRSRNAELVTYYEELDGLLAATLGVDDYVDLESLLIVKVEHPPFDPGDLKPPADPLPDIVEQPPVYEPPRPLRFTTKKKQAELESQARARHEQALRKWDEENEAILAAHVADAERHRKYLEAVEKYREECREREMDAQAHNQELTELIHNLAIGVESAVREYVDIVLSHSVYPDAFLVSTEEREFSLPDKRLGLTVVVPPPSAIKTVKEYTYVKDRDEIHATQFPKKEQKWRYANAVYQVAVRTLHEIFEADRNGWIHSISLTIASYTISDTTGRHENVPLVIVEVDREKFSQIDLANVEDCRKTLVVYLGAAVSKSPFDLKPAPEPWRERELPRKAREGVRDVSSLTSEHASKLVEAVRRRVEQAEDSPAGDPPSASRFRFLHAAANRMTTSRNEERDISDQAGELKDRRS